MPIAAVRCEKQVSVYYYFEVPQPKVASMLTQMSQQRHRQPIWSGMEREGVSVDVSPLVALIQDAFNKANPFERLLCCVGKGKLTNQQG